MNEGAVLKAFAETVCKRHGRVAGRVERSVLRPLLRGPDAGFRAPRERLQTIVRREIRTTQVWVPRIDVRVQAFPQAIVSRGTAALPRGRLDVALRTRQHEPDGRNAERGGIREAASPRDEFLAVRAARKTAADAAGPKGPPEPAILAAPRRVERVVRRSSAPTILQSAPPRPSSPAVPVREAKADARLSDADVAQLTDRVMRSIDQRLRAYRERLGRA